MNNEPIVFKVRKAQSTQESITSVTIVIDREIERLMGGESLKVLDKRYEEDSNILFQALTRSLPGGTLDRLLCKMLKAKASHFIIPSWAEGAK